MAAVIAMIVAGLVYLVLNAKTRPSEPTQPQRATVLVAATDISAYETIVPEMLGTTQVKVEEAPAGHLSAAEQAIGKIARVDINTDQVLTQSNVGPRSAAQGLTFVIDEGMRAVTVALDPISGVGGFVVPGDRVDVLATFQHGEVATTKTILQNVRILAINEVATRAQATGQGQQQQQQTDQPEGAEGAEGAEGGAPSIQTVKNATLAVTPEEAQMLILSAYKAAIHLVLRPREDQSLMALAATNDWEIMGMQPPEGALAPRPREQEAAEEQPTERQLAAMGWPREWQPPSEREAAPAAEAEPGPTVEVIRGTEREVVSAQ